MGLADQLDLDLAWKRVLGEARREHELPDILRLKDFDHAWERRRPSIAENFEDPPYAPRQARLVEVAKSEFMTRPVAVLHPDDRTAYTAMVAEIAPHIEAVMPGEVFSARLTEKPEQGRLIEDPRRAWLRFEKQGLALYDDHHYTSLLTTDVSSYFEYVDIGKLNQDLSELPAVEDNLRKCLINFLNELQRSSEHWGLPQSNVPSSILGNLYLLPGDRALQRHPVVFIRFQDDVKVFAPHDVALRKALRELLTTLRHRRLNLSPQKTGILEGDAVREAFEDSRKAAIQYGLQISDDTTGAELRALFDDAVSGEINARDVRFCVYRFGLLSDDYALEWILENLVRVPYLASVLAGYLKTFWAPAVEEAVAAFVNDRDRNIYPFLEMHLMRLLAFAEEIGEEGRDAIWFVLQDQNKEEFVREHAAMAAGQHALAGDASLLRGAFDRASNFWMRRALLVSASTAAPLDGGWLKRVSRAHPELRSTCDYLKQVGRGHIEP